MTKIPRFKTAFVWWDSKDNFYATSRCRHIHYSLESAEICREERQKLFKVSTVSILDIDTGDVYQKLDDSYILTGLSIGEKNLLLK